MSAEDIEYMGDYKEFPTKESALDWLDNYLSLDERNNLIRALQQEPCEDAISRQAAIKSLMQYAEGKKTIGQCIDECPSVTPKQRTGHWILARTFPTKLYDEYLTEYECSECYRRIRCTESQLVNYPYCHCGSKM